MVDSSTFDDASGGEFACYAHLLCQECGVVLHAGVHLATCPRALASDKTTDIPR